MPGTRCEKHNRRDRCAVASFRSSRAATDTTRLATVMLKRRRHVVVALYPGAFEPTSRPHLAAMVQKRRPRRCAKTEARRDTAAVEAHIALRPTAGRTPRAPGSEHLRAETRGAQRVPPAPSGTAEGPGAPSMAQSSGQLVKVRSVPEALTSSGTQQRPPDCEATGRAEDAPAGLSHGARLHEDIFAAVQATLFGRKPASVTPVLAGLNCATCLRDLASAGLTRFEDQTFCTRCFGELAREALERTSPLCELTPSGVFRATAVVAPPPRAQQPTCARLAARPRETPPHAPPACARGQRHACGRGPSGNTIRAITDSRSLSSVLA